MTTSAYPSAVAALLAIFNTAFPVGAGTTVFQGPGSSDTGDLKFVHVGIQSLDLLSTPGSAGSGQVTWATMGTNHSRDERFAVNCVARAWSGDNDPAARLADVFALFDAAVSAVRSDPSIGRPGGVLYVDNYTWDHSESFDQTGTWSLLDFTFNFRARI